MLLQNPVTNPVFLLQVHQILEVVATNSRALLQFPRLPSKKRNTSSLIGKNIKYHLNIIRSIIRCFHSKIVQQITIEVSSKRRRVGYIFKPKKYVFKLKVLPNDIHEMNYNVSLIYKFNSDFCISILKVCILSYVIIDNLKISKWSRIS